MPLIKSTSVLAICCAFCIVSTENVRAQEYTDDFYERIAARAAGEASFSEEAFAAVVCTMKNRLQKGWTPDNVLHAYYAPDVPPSPEQIAIAWEVLRGHRYCNPDFYFCLGFQDRWNPRTKLVGVVQTADGHKGIRLYKRH